MGLIDNQNRPGGLNVFNGTATRHSVLLLMDDIEPFFLFVGEGRIINILPGIFLEGLNVDDHDLDLVIHSKLANPAQIL